jgi:prevent-host-death family protein
VARVIPQRELRNQNARIMDAVAAGESFVITRNGEPVAELRPFAETHRQAPRRFVPKDEVDAALRPLGPGHFKEWLAELDELVDQTLDDPWQRKGAPSQEGLD